MRLSLSVRLQVAALAALLGVAAPAQAQFLAPAQQSAGFDLSLRQPTLRLAMLGGVYLAVEDQNNQINQWDFGGSSVGLLGDRRSNSVDMWADTRGFTDTGTYNDLDSEVSRAHGLGIGIQAVARNTDKFAFGLHGGYIDFGDGVPRGAGVYQDRTLNIPVATAVLSGRFGKRVGYGAQLTVGHEKYTQPLRTTPYDEEDNKFLLKDGETLPPATPFDLEEGEADLFGFGAGLGWTDEDNRFDATVNYDHVSNDIVGSNTTPRRVYEIYEPRSVDRWSAIFTMRPWTWLQGGLAVGVDGYDVTETYRFSLSGGTGGTPQTGRGDRLERDSEGRFSRMRVMVNPPAIQALTIGADFNVRYDRMEIDPSTTAGNYNDFINSLEGDTLALGEPVVESADENRHWDAGLGLGWKAGSNLLVSVQGSRANDAIDGLSIRSRRRVTDLRGGLEYGVSSSWTARVGGYHRATDADVYTANNERVANGVTLGAGYRPTDSKFGLDGGIDYQWRSTDFPDPTDETGSGLRVMLYSRWYFD